MDPTDIKSVGLGGWGVVLELFIILFLSPKNFKNLFIPSSSENR